jgi:hypothetical protein
MRSYLRNSVVHAGFAAAFVAGASLVTAAQIRPTPTPTPEAEVISRADDFPIDDGRIYLPANPQGNEQPARPDPTAALEERIRSLESVKREDPEARQRRLLLSLDILTRAEQRVEALRKQLFEMIEKENSIQLRLDSIEMDARPEMIERSVATMGSLRPEELREARHRQLNAEMASLRRLLSEVQRNKANIEGNILKAEDLVERIRTRLEREIDDALTDPGSDQDTDSGTELF